MKNTSKEGSLRDSASRLRGLLIQAGRNAELRDPLATVLEEAGYTPAQIHAIFWTGSDGSLTMGELAHRIGSEKTVTGIVDRLERDGVLVRIRDTKDRRVVKVRLSKKGEGIYGQLDRHLRSKLMGFLGVLNREEREVIFRVVTKLADAGERQLQAMPRRASGR